MKGALNTLNSIVLENMKEDILKREDVLKNGAKSEYWKEIILFGTFKKHAKKTKSK